MRLLGMDTFETWLDTELARQARRSAMAAVPIPRYAVTRSHRTRNRLVLGLTGLAGSKLALAATATVALAAVGVGTKAVATGDANPLSWGSKVTQQVQACKAGLSSGQHGIGPCVSSFAKQHGDQTSDQHSQAGTHGNGHANGHASSQTDSPSPGHGPGQGHQPGPPSPFPGNAPPSPHS